MVPLAAACGGEPVKPDPPEEPSALTGTWTGSVVDDTDPSFVVSFRLEVEHESGDLTGSVEVVRAQEGDTLTGPLQGAYEHPHVLMRFLVIADGDSVSVIGYAGERAGEDRIDGDVLLFGEESPWDLDLSRS